MLIDNDDQACPSQAAFLAADLPPQALDCVLLRVYAAVIAAEFDGHSVSIAIDHLNDRTRRIAVSKNPSLLHAFAECRPRRERAVHLFRSQWFR